MRYINRLKNYISIILLCAADALITETLKPSGTKRLTAKTFKLLTTSEK